jgi:hypothetical protein
MNKKSQLWELPKKIKAKISSHNFLSISFDCGNLPPTNSTIFIYPHSVNFDGKKKYIKMAASINTILCNHYIWNFG